MFLKQSTAVTVKIGPFVDSTDGNTQETALTISQADIRLSKGGGAFAQTNNAAGATHDANGWYGVPLDATDTNTVGKLELFVHESGALCVWRTFFVVPANVYDSLVGTDKLQVHTDEITAGLITAAAIADGAIDAATFAAGAIDGTAVAASAKTGYSLTATERDNIVAAMVAKVLSGTVTWEQAIRGVLAACTGKADGFPAGPAHYRDPADTKNVITATVDADGNRTAVTLNLT